LYLGERHVYGVSVVGNGGDEHVRAKPVTPLGDLGTRHDRVRPLGARTDATVGDALPKARKPLPELNAVDDAGGLAPHVVAAGRNARQAAHKIHVLPAHRVGVDHGHALDAVDDGADVDVSRRVGLDALVLNQAGADAVALLVQHDTVVFDETLDERGPWGDGLDRGNHRARARVDRVGPHGEKVRDQRVVDVHVLTINSRDRLVVGRGIGPDVLQFPGTVLAASAVLHQRHEGLCKTRQGKTRQDKTRQDKTRQDKTRQDKARQGKTRQDKTRQKTCPQGRKRNIHPLKTKTTTNTHLCVERNERRTVFGFVQIIFTEHVVAPIEHHLKVRGPGVHHSLLTRLGLGLGIRD
jgi:hypothetical protein